MPKAKKKVAKRVSDKSREKLKAEAKSALDNGTWTEKFAKKK